MTYEEKIAHIQSLVADPVTRPTAVIAIMSVLLPRMPVWIIDEILVALGEEP